MMAKQTNHLQWTRLATLTDKHYSLDLTQVVKMSVTNNSSFQDYPDPDDHTIQTTDTPGFKPFTMIGEYCNDVTAISQS